MSESKHTPGPWRAEDAHDGYEIVSSSPQMSGTVAVLSARRSVTGAADARLIAAAPETTDALRKLVNEVAGLAVFGPEIKALIGVTNWNVLEQRVQEARQAITKAEIRL